MMFYKNICAVLLATLLALPVHADEQDQRKSAAIELVKATKADQTLDQIFPLIVDQIFPLLIQGNEGHEVLVNTILKEEFKASLPKFKAEFIDLIAGVYEQNFNTDELNQLTAFMKSPTGQKFVSKQVEVFQQSSAGGELIGQKMALDAIPRVIQRLEDANLTTPK